MWNIISWKLYRHPLLEDIATCGPLFRRLWQNLSADRLVNLCESCTGNLALMVHSLLW